MAFASVPVLVVQLLTPRAFRPQPLPTEYFNGVMPYCGIILIDFAPLMEPELWQNYHEEIEPVAELMSDGPRCGGTGGK